MTCHIAVDIRMTGEYSLKYIYVFVNWCIKALEEKQCASMVGWIYIHTEWNVILKISFMKKWGKSLVVQWLGLYASTAEGTGLIPRLGTKIPQAMKHWPPKLKQNKKEKISRGMRKIGRTSGKRHSKFLQVDAPYICNISLKKIFFSAIKIQSSEFPTSLRFMDTWNVFAVSRMLVHCARLSLVSNIIVWTWKQNGASFWWH